MTFKKLGRIVCVTAISGLVVAAPVFSGCSTSHPEAKITVEFAGETYVLEYKLYRNMYPQTVQHFIELADNDFYDNTIIHNYQSDKWYGGGYSYSDAEERGYVASYEDGAESMLDYLEASSKEYEYATLADPEKGLITPSVYRDFIEGDLSQPLTTLIGEFSNNQHKIENGALNASYGCLRMFYTAKDVDGKRVYLDKQGSEKGVMGEYKYNSATSLFSIQVNSSTSSDSSYCIFGVLQNTDVLDDLKEVVSDASSDVGSTNFTKEISLYVDNFDEFIDPQVNEVTYKVTATPIIIRTVEITKY